MKMRLGHSRAKASHGSTKTCTLILSLVATLTFTLMQSDAALARDNEKTGFLDQFASWFTEDFLQGKGTSITHDGFGRTTASWSDGRNKLKVRLEGEIEFGDDDRTISYLSRNGSFTIWELRNSRTTKLIVEADRDGELHYEFEVDGKDAQFEEKGRAWLAEVLVEVIRKTGIGAESRAHRILDEDGVYGFLDEVQFVESDYVKRIFLTAAIQRADLTSADCSAIISEAAASMESDYEKAELLRTVVEHRDWSPTLAADFVDVVATMESDYEIRRSLSNVRIDEAVDPSVIDAILQIAAHMESDYETAELLIGFAPHCGKSDRLSEMYVQAVAGIGSDYEARRTLKAFPWERNVSVNTLVTALTIAGRLESDYEAAELLSDLAPYSADDPRTVAAFMAAAAHVGSDYECGRVLKSFADNERLSNDAVLALLYATHGISSSYEQAGVLRKTIPHVVGVEELEDAFLDAVDAVNSDYERDRLFSDYYRGDRDARRARRGE